MINSKNNGYVFFWNSNKKTSEGTIIDFNSKNQYCYKITDKKDFEHFCTKNSIPILSFEENSKLKFEYNTEELDNNKSKILITKFKVSKNGKKKISDTIKIDNEKKDLVFNYNLLKFFSEKYFDETDLTFLGEKIPTLILFEYKHGFIRTFELDKIEKIDKLLSTTKVTTN